MSMLFLFFPFYNALHYKTFYGNHRANFYWLIPAATKEGKQTGGAGWQTVAPRKSNERLTVVGGGLERGLGLCGSKGVPDQATAAPQVVLPVVEAPELPGPAVWRQR